jgi:hypothetical protein
MEICNVLKEFVVCFAWEYTEMLSIDRNLVGHRLQIKPGFRPHKQLTRNFSHKIILHVKEEVDRLLKAGFIQPYRYAEWVSNIVPVEKKNTVKAWICVDFRDLNRATPKDEYPMPVVDTLINNASGNKVISVLDRNMRYNQIFIGLFEWIVVTFGLKNAYATYQQAMNLIFMIYWV